jgi:hypothetical protein
MLDLTNGFFKKLADSFDDPPFQEKRPRAVQTIDLPLAEEKQETTGERVSMPLRFPPCGICFSCSTIGTAISLKKSLRTILPRSTRCSLTPEHNKRMVGEMISTWKHA